MSENIGNWLKLIWGIAAINIPNAGVGKPINELDCFSSILNLAKRQAENIGIRNANDAGINRLLSNIEWRKIMPLLM